MDYSKMEEKINKLIKSGKIKSEEDLADIPINEISEKYHLCIKDFICYSCHKDNNGCKFNCENEDN